MRGAGFMDDSRRVRKVWLVFFLAWMAVARAEQTVEMVAGPTDWIELRYGYEGAWFGGSVAPGIVSFVASKFRDDEVLPTTWVPALSVFKTVTVGERVSLVPRLSVVYVYGYGGMLAGSCMTCGIVQTRDDRAYLKAAVGFRYRVGHWFVQLDPGLAMRSEYTYFVKGYTSSLRKKEGDWSFDGLHASGSLGFQFGGE
jgi:hypothetical protein